MNGPPFTAVLMAGGSSRRMGSDKAFLELDGQTLWERQLSTLEKLAPHRLLITANAQQDFTKAKTRAEVLVDPQTELGPLAALIHCLQHSDWPVLILAVDMPQMSTALLNDHILTASTNECGAVFVRNGLAEPLAASYPKACLPLAEKELREGKGAFQPFIRACLKQDVLTAIDASDFDPTLFKSLNRPEDIAGV